MLLLLLLLLFKLLFVLFELLLLWLLLLLLLCKGLLLLLLVGRFVVGRFNNDGWNNEVKQLFGSDTAAAGDIRGKSSLKRAKLRARVA